MSLNSEVSVLKRRKPIQALVVNPLDLSGNSGGIPRIAGARLEFGGGSCNGQRINPALGKIEGNQLIIDDFGPIDEGLSEESPRLALESQAARFINDWSLEAKEGEVCLWISPQEEGNDREYEESRFVAVVKKEEDQFEFRGFPGQQNLEDCWQTILRLTEYMPDDFDIAPPLGIEENRENLLRRQPFVFEASTNKTWLEILREVGVIDEDIYQTIETGLDWRQAEEARAEVETVIDQHRGLIFNATTHQQRKALAFTVQRQLNIIIKDRACLGSDSPFKRLYQRVQEGEKAWSEREGLVHCPCGIWIPKNQGMCPCGLHNPRANQL